MTPNTKNFATGDINFRNQSVPFSPNAERRNFRQRAFGKLEKGSLRGSIFALCASAIGSGVLSLPYVLGLNGWILGIVFILVGAFGKADLYVIILNSCCMESIPNRRVGYQSESSKLLKACKLRGWKETRAVPSDKHPNLHVGLLHLLLDHQ